MIILFTGPPGSGKGTQSQLLAEREDFEIFSLGAKLRARAQNDIELAQLLGSGELAPSSLVKEMIFEFLETHQAGRGILDGAPREEAQVDWFIEWCQGHPTTRVVLLQLKLDESAVSQRLQARGRPDDKPQSLAHRLEIYHQHTEPVVAQLARHIPFYQVDGAGSVETVYQRIITSGVIETSADTD